MRQVKDRKGVKQTQRKQRHQGRKQGGRQRKQTKHLYTLNKQQELDDSGSLDERLYEDKMNRNKGQQQYDDGQYQSQMESQQQGEQIEDINSSYRDQQQGIQRLQNSQDQQTATLSESNNGHSKQYLNSYKNYQDRVLKSKNNQERILRHNTNYNTNQNTQHNKQQLNPRSKDERQKMVQLYMTIRQLEQQNELLKNSLSTHQQRQTQMVSKYAKLQADNNRLKYQITKINKTNYQKLTQFQSLNNIKGEIQTMKRTNQQLLAQIDKENIRIVTYLKTLLNKICQQNTNNKQVTSQNNNINDPINNSQGQSLSKYLDKCISTLKQNHQNITKKFNLSQQIQKKDQNRNNLNERSNKNFSSIPNEKIQNHQQLLTIPSYELERIPQLVNENTLLKQQLNRIKQQFHKLSQTYKKTQNQKQTQSKNQHQKLQTQFKNQQKVLCQKYNTLIEQIKNKYKSLQTKIHQQQNKHETKINQLQKLILQKQRVIKKLKDQLRQANIRLDQIEEERFSLLKNQNHTNNKNDNNNERIKNRRLSFNNSKQSSKKYIDGDYILNDMLLSNNNDKERYSNDKERSNIDKERSSSVSYHSQHINPHLHQQSLCEYKPQRKRKRNNLYQQQEQFQTKNKQMMRKSHTKNNKNNQDIQISKEYQDIQNLNQQIQQLQRQILEQFQYQT